MSSLGSLLVLAALLASVVGAALAFAGGARKVPAAVEWARRLAYAFAALLLAANVVMEVALLKLDFSVHYVAEVGSREVPMWVRGVSLWSSLEGSILFWGLVLGVYVVLGARTLKRFPREEPWGLGVLLACGTFFAFLIAGPASPFGTVSPVPPDGPGPNPLLQNSPLMIIHPPMLYLGYVGMVVPFALAAAALFSGKLGPALLQSLRRWTIVPWLFLTVGIILGAWWAYDVLGWGGYWGWDPVENAPLMPWLTAAAAVHAMLVIERRKVLRGWAVGLVLTSFLLTILGTFMTRSGVFNSVHAFSQSNIGPTFLTFLALCLVFSVLLLALRMDKLGRPGNLEQAVSREGFVVLGNLVLVVIMLTVLLGTVFPLIAQAVEGIQVSVGEPYFDRMTVPLAVAVLFLMGIGPALPWGRSGAQEWKPLIASAVAGAVLAALGLVLGARDPWLLVTLFAAGLTLHVTLVEMFRPVAQRLKHGRGLVAALKDELGAGRRRLGGYLAHLGIVVALVAVGVSHVGKLENDVTLTQGQSAAVGHYVFKLGGIRTVNEPQRQRLVAHFDVLRDGKPVGALEPALNYYFTQREPIGTPAVRTSLTDDFYLSAMSVDPGSGTVGLRAFVNPMVGWLWVGALIVAAGLLLAGWPRGRTAEAAALEAEAQGASVPSAAPAEPA